MSTCICNSCKNLKSIIGSDENGITEDCEFGFPSESCSECAEGKCEITCKHYIEDCEEEEVITVQCGECGKELKIIASNTEIGAVYCPICYLNK